MATKTNVGSKYTTRKILSIDETKLGITIVISKVEAKSLGFTGKEPTSEAIREIRKRLGLPAQRLRP